MKLQVNNSGAWKNVMTFQIEHMEHVKTAAAELAQCAALADSSVDFRILDGTERVVLHYNNKGRLHAQAWSSPAWMCGQEIVP